MSKPISMTSNRYASRELPVEIIHQICSFLPLSSLYIAIQIDRVWYETCKPIIYQAPPFGNCKQIIKLIKWFEESDKGRDYSNTSSKRLKLDEFHLVNKKPASNFVKEINLSTVNHRWRDLKEIDFLKLFSHLPNITSLNLSLCQITQITLEMICETYKDQLTTLCIERCMNIKEGFSIIGKWCSKLKILNLNEVDILDEDLALLLSNNKDTLTWISLEGCELISDSSVILLKDCKKLQYINLQGCYGVLSSFDIGNWEAEVMIEYY